MSKAVTRSGAHSSQAAVAADSAKVETISSALKRSQEESSDEQHKSVTETARDKMLRNIAEAGAQKQREYESVAGGASGVEAAEFKASRAMPARSRREGASLTGTARAGYEPNYRGASSLPSNRYATVSPATSSRPSRNHSPPAAIGAGAGWASSSSFVVANGGNGFGGGDGSKEYSVRGAIQGAGDRRQLSAPLDSLHKARQGLRSRLMKGV